MTRLSKLKLFKNKFFKRSAIILLALALILGIFLVFFQMFQSSMIQVLTQMNNEFVDQVDTISGAMLEIINNTAMQIFYSASTKSLRMGVSLTNAQRVAGLRDLGNLVSSSTFLTSAMIYNSNLDYIFTSEGGLTSASRELFLDKSTAELLQSRTRPGLGAPLKRESPTGEVYSFLFFEPNTPGGGSLILNVRADWWERQLFGIGSGSDGLILDDNGEIITAGSEDLVDDVAQMWPTLLRHFEHGPDYGFVLHNDEKNGWMYRRLSNLGWYYLRAFNTETILPGMTKVKNSVLGILIGVVILLISGAIYSIFVLYMPIQAMRQALDKAGKGKKAMVQEVDRLLEDEFEQLLTQQIEEILQGKNDVDIPFPASLILVDTTNCEMVKKVLSPSHPEQTLVGKNSFGSAIIVDTCSQEEVLALCETISETMGCRCLYGLPRESALGLAECRQNLLELWNLRFLFPGHQIFSEEIVTERGPLDLQTKNTEPLFNALRGGQLQEARDYWQLTFDKISLGRFGDFRFFIRYIFKRLAALQTEVGLNPLADLQELVDDLDDVTELHETLDRIFFEITAVQEERRKQGLSELAEKVNEHIARDFSNEALSAHQIADEVGMNPVYLGRLFRESTGISISEAIKRTRVEHAKTLLRQTADPVKDIALSVGFANTKYFFVVFKDLVGMTPKEFQNQE